MGFLAPAALGFLALIPGIVALYILRLRRRDRPMPSTWLWQQADPEQRANRPWQRLRLSWLLVLQVLAALALALAAAHPFRWVAAGSGGNVILLLDGTAAMRASDGRWSEALRLAGRLVDAMAPGDRMSIVLLTRAPEVLAADTADPAALRGALAAARPGAGDGDLAAGLDVALSLLQGRGTPEIVVIGNGRYLNTADLPRVPVPVRYLPVGGPQPNLAVTAFAARAQAGGRTALAQVANFGPEPAAAAIQFWADGALAAVAEQTLNPGETRAFTWPVPSAARLLEVRLPGADALGLDDRAWALAGGAERGRALLVTAGNPFLERALRAIPGLAVAVAAPAGYDPAGHDLVVLDGWEPPEPPPGNVLRVAPPGGVEVAVTDPVRGAAGEPLLNHVEAGTVHVARARRLAPPPTARILWQAGELPLVWADGSQVTFAFDVRDSDLPLQPAFPILIQNLVTHLLPPSPADPVQVQPGQPVTLRPWPGTSALRILRPDGEALDWPLDRVEGLPFTATDLPGLYQVEEELADRTRRSAFAVNVFSNLASNLEPAGQLDLPAGAAPAPAEPRQAPWDLWPYLAALGLSVVALEWWVYSRGLAL